MAWYDSSPTLLGPDPNLALTDPGKGYAGYASAGPSATSSSSSGMDGSKLMGLAILGGVFGSIGTAYSQASALKATGAYRLAVADTNAKIADLSAKQTLEAGDIAASRKNLETQGRVGAIRAAQGASGIDVNTGSAKLTQIGTQFAGNIDELTIRNNAARRAWGYKTQAISDTYEGQFSRMTAASEAQQTLLTGGMQAIEGPLEIGANYLRFARYMDKYSAEGSAGGVPYPAVSR